MLSGGGVAAGKCPTRPVFHGDTPSAHDRHVEKLLRINCLVL